MIYPKFFPYPSCWLKGLGLALYAIPAFIFLYCVFWVIVVPMVLITQFHSSIVFLGIIITTFSYWLAITGIYHFLWGKPDPNPQHLKWLPSNESFKEGFYRTLFSIISLFVTIMITLPLYHNSYRCFYNINYRIHCYDYLDWISFSAWIITTSYCFHIQKLLKFKANKNNR